MKLICYGFLNQLSDEIVTNAVAVEKIHAIQSQQYE
jgi:hypothetical protein